MVLFKVVASAYLTYYLKLLLYECAYVRAQVEVAMAGWTTEETRALPGLRGAVDAHNRAPHLRRSINVPRVCS